MQGAMQVHAEVLPAFSGSLGIYDHGLGCHCERVKVNAMAIGRAVGLGTPATEVLRWAGQLHDLGKLAVPITVLNKQSPLEPGEWEEIMRHPDTGADVLLMVSPSLAPVADAIRSHHERWDGKGYPLGLEGDGIPLLGRIVALADVFDALCDPRPYRRHPFTEGDAVAYVADHRGMHFDPALVDVFLELHRAGALATG